jgi:U1 small nuclear ribonucleoprotein C
MPKYYCDYCDTYLTHDSPSVRKTHCQGRKHKENVRDYYQKWMEEQAQKLVNIYSSHFRTPISFFFLSFRLIKQQQHINPEN